MKTEKQVREILKTVDERIADRITAVWCEYVERAVNANNEIDENAYTQRALAMQEFARIMGYDGNREIAGRIRRNELVCANNSKVTEGF